MGICTSCEAVAAAVTTVATAKVIFTDGELREYDRSVRVSHVLQKDPTCFVCDADVMEIDGFVSAVGGGEELRPGNLYFLLPRTMLKHRLHAEDLAALAVRASSALMKAAPAGERIRRGATVSPLVFNVGSGEGTAAGGEVRAADEEEGKKPNKKRRGIGRKFAAELSAIPE
ncbi:uncharacterized protein LOC103724372 [Phoenix dactylifera]|uniref:Uncharacterized protein LOC103724372 n=1 Tax=Phoenix dactylifera TaxID=42345 RepID=A0A8B7D6R9_PHODC|nr:uncharacterized protein LOC103724372 [Phoenix dactylifera]